MSMWEPPTPGDDTLQVTPASAVEGPAASRSRARAGGGGARS